MIVVKGGIHCLITKTSELGICLLHFSYVLSQNGVTSHRFHPLDPPLFIQYNKKNLAFHFKKFTIFVSYNFYIYK